MKATETRTNQKVMALPPSVRITSIIGTEPDGDGEIWQIKIGCFLISSIRWHPESALYTKKVEGRTAELPWEFQVDVTGKHGRSIHESYWLQGTGIATQEEAMCAGLAALKEAVGPVAAFPG